MLLLTSEEFLDLVETEDTSLRRGVAQVRAFLRHERVRLSRARMLDRLHQKLGLAPEDDDRDVAARISEDPDGDLYARWYGDVPGLQRLQILDELSRIELAVCRG